MELKLFGPLGDKRPEQAAFAPVVCGSCEDLGEVLLLDCWMWSRPWPVAPEGQAQVSVRVGRAFVGGHLEATEGLKFRESVFKASGLFAWLRHRVPMLDVEVDADLGTVWSFRDAASIPLLDANGLRVDARVGFAGSGDRSASEPVLLEQQARIVVASIDDGQDLPAHWTAATVFVRLLELLNYRPIALELELLYLMGQPGTAEKCLRPLSDSPSYAAEGELPSEPPAIPLQGLEADWSTLCSRWLNALARNGLPYHRLARGLSINGGGTLEDRFINIVMAVAAWVEHGGGSKAKDPARQLEEVLDFGRACFGVRWPDEGSKLATGARHYLVHGNMGQRPALMYSSPEFLLGWTRRLTAALWAAVLSDVGVPLELVKSAVHRHSRLRFDVHRAGRGY